LVVRTDELFVSLETAMVEAILSVVVNGKSGSATSQHRVELH
jgi:hypothetical protein